MRWLLVLAMSWDLVACSQCDVCPAGSGACLSDADCAGDQLCNLFDRSVRDQCGACAPKSCDDGCGPGMQCSDGVCTAAFKCNGDADCDNGSVCKRTACASDCVDALKAGDLCAGASDGSDGNCFDFTTGCGDGACGVDGDSPDGVCVDDASASPCACEGDGFDWQLCVERCGVPCLATASEGDICDFTVGGGCAIHRPCADGLVCEIDTSNVETNDVPSRCVRH